MRHRPMSYKNPTERGNELAKLETLIRRYSFREAGNISKEKW